MRYLDIPARRATPAPMLVHGSWHTGSCWSAVKEHLSAAGVEPAGAGVRLPFHGDAARERAAVGRWDRRVAADSRSLEERCLALTADSERTG